MQTPCRILQTIQLLLAALLYIRVNHSSERLSDLPRVTRQENERVRTRVQVHLNPQLMLLSWAQAAEFPGIQKGSPGTCCRGRVGGQCHQFQGRCSLLTPRPGAMVELPLTPGHGAILTRVAELGLGPGSPSRDLFPTACLSVLVTSGHQPHSYSGTPLNSSKTGTKLFIWQFF